MTGTRRPLRNLADAACRCASHLMPRVQRRWMAATRNELHAIGDDRAALRWALGGLRTACMARCRSLHLLDHRSVRWSGALISLYCALSVMFPTLLTLALGLQRTRLLEALGQVTPGDDWHRFVPLMEQLPDWLHAMLLWAGCCYMAGALGLLRRRGTAAIALVAGVALDLATRSLAQLVIEPAHLVVHDPSLLAQAILPVVLPLLLSFAALAGSKTEAVE
jgi:hypothetical protein